MRPRFLVRPDLKWRPPPAEAVVNSALRCSAVHWAACALAEFAVPWALGVFRVFEECLEMFSLGMLFPWSANFRSVLGFAAPAGGRTDSQHHQYTAEPSA